MEVRFGCVRLRPLAATHHHALSRHHSLSLPLAKMSLAPSRLRRSGRTATDSKDGFGAYAEVAPADFVSRVLAQCVVQPGLSDVYEEILLQVSGSREGVKRE